MGQAEQKAKEEFFFTALKGKKIPILTLDHTWYRLFETMSEEKELTSLEKQLNDLLKRQGRLNTETKDIRKLKKKLMGEIVPMVDELEQGSMEEKHSKEGLEKKIEENKRLIEECNEKLDEYQNELLDIPSQIDAVNFNLMLATMKYCYEKMQNNTEEIQEITEWVNTIRVELKKKLIRKQEKELRNHHIYSFMHDIFGMDVINLFDMKYDPEKQYPKKEEKAVGKDMNEDEKA